MEKAVRDMFVRKLRGLKKEHKTVTFELNKQKHKIYKIIDTMLNAEELKIEDGGHKWRP